MKQVASALTALALLTAAGRVAHAEPTVELPPEAPALASPLGRTTLGGYGELHWNHRIPATGDATSELDLHRLVLFVGHAFTDALRFSSEIEVEHAIAGEGQPGYATIEQAYVDWDLAGRALTLRAGIVLVPMGLTNETHEPPTFHGVERPNVERNIIPTTWREGGLGLVGQVGERFRYQAYLLGGLDADGYSLGSGVRGGRQNVAEARADGLAFAGAVAWEPVVGLSLGLSGYLGQAGANATTERFGADGAALDLDVTTVGVAAHAQCKGHGLEAKALFATFFIGDTAALRDARDADGNADGKDLASQILGGYVEVAYDVLRSSGSAIALLPFVRAEHYDTAAAFDGREASAADDDRAVTDLVLGATLRPVPQVAFKADVILRSFGGEKDAETLANLGVGFNF